MNRANFTIKLTIGSANLHKNMKADFTKINRNEIKIF